MRTTTLEIYTSKLNNKQQLKLEVLDAILNKEWNPNIAEKVGCSLRKVEAIEKEYGDEIAIWMFNKGRV